ncbi:MAG: glycosyltransferase family 9 protein, partial [Candidatus Eisenbacteria bacterium]|nr:glycosyltransferase family 9 protein [Candidatus Eisenbacteria bacterium]
NPARNRMFIESSIIEFSLSFSDMEDLIKDSREAFSDIQASFHWVPADGEPPMIAGAILDRLGPEVSALSKKRIGLVPHARYPLKECPLKTYIDFSKRLLQEGYEPVWFWDPERPLEMGRDEMEGHRVIQAPLKEVALEMSGCRVIVAGDTGLAHLAAAVGRPVISIFGSTVPEFGYTPIGRHSIVEVDLPCRPCHVHGAKWCWMGHRLCLEEIDPDVLIQHVRLLA